MVASNPDGALREAVYSAWCEVLNLDAASFDPGKGFIESGGYSVLGLKLIERLKSQLHAEPDLGALLDDLTAIRLVDLMLEQQLGLGGEAGADGWDEGYI